jgi:hypothetical protein
MKKLIIILYVLIALAALTFATGLTVQGRRSLLRGSLTPAENTVLAQRSCYNCGLGLMCMGEPCICDYCGAQN